MKKGIQSQTDAQAGELAKQVEPLGEDEDSQLLN
jgi:hypothetical protein